MILRLATAIAIGPAQSDNFLNRATAPRLRRPATERLIEEDDGERRSDPVGDDQQEALYFDGVVDEQGGDTETDRAEPDPPLVHERTASATS